MSGTTLAALSAREVRPAVFVRAQFATSTLHIWSGTGTMNWNGQNWTGVGTFGSVSPIEEGATVEAKGITLTLSGIDPNMLADALQEMQIGLPVTVWLGLLGTDGFLIDGPLTSWRGRMDPPTIDIAGAR